MAQEPAIIQLLQYTEMATNKQYLIALTEKGKIYYCQRELLVGGVLHWTEITSVLPA